MDAHRDNYMYGYGSKYALSGLIICILLSLNHF